MAIPHDGAGATLALDGATYVGRVISIGSFSMSRDIIDDTDLADTDEQAKPATLVRHEPFEVEAYFNPEEEPFSSFNDNPFTLDEMPNTVSVVITLPLGVGQTTPSDITGTGFVNEISSAPFRHGDNLIHTFSVKWAAAPAITAAS